MRRHLALIGDASWLLAERLQRVREHGSVQTALLETPQQFSANDLPEQRGVALFDCVHHGEFALAAATELRSRGSSFRCVADVPDDCCEATIAQLVAAGFWGIVFQSAPPAAVCDVIQRVSKGRLCYPSAIMDRIQTHDGHMTLAGAPTSELDRLSADEKALLSLLAGGMTTPSAALKLGIEIRAAKRMRTAFMERLQLPDSASIVRFAVRAGLI